MPVTFTFRPIIVLWDMLVIFTFGPTIYYGLCPWYLRLVRSSATGYVRDIYVCLDYRTMGYARDIYVWPDHRTTGYARDIYVPSDHRTMEYARDIYVWSDHLLRAMPVIFKFGPIVCYGLCPWYLRLSRLSYHGLCPWYLRLVRSSATGYARGCGSRGW